MLYININDALTDDDTHFIYELMKNYRNWHYDDSSIESAMGLCSDGPSYCAYTGDQRVEMSIYEILECIRADMTVTSDQLHTICCTLQDAINRYDAGIKVDPLYNNDVYKQATTVLAVVKHMYTESQVQWSQMLPLMADAMLGHFGPDYADPDTWSDIVKYFKTYMPAADEWCVMLAWSMIHADKHVLCDEVFDMADRLYNMVNAW